MRRTSARLADGREIIYFDQDCADVRDAVDRRPLSPTMSASELRWDPLLGEYVAIASHRQDRTYLPPADECPLCPSRDGRLTEIPSSDYDVVVFENRFPAFTERAPGGRGRCEVVCFTSDHDRSFRELTSERVRTVVDVWADRTEELSRLDGVRWVYPFENRGAEVRVTLGHPHGQIYAYPYVTPRTKNLLASIASYGPSLMGDILEFEAKSERVLVTGEHFTVFVPFAARWPIEVHMLPHRHVPDLAAANAGERAEIAVLYRRVLRALDRLYDTPTPYIAAWHQAPVHLGRDTVRLHLELTSPRRAADRLKYLAGSESAMGAWIGDVRPEDAADRIRRAIQMQPIESV